MKIANITSSDYNVCWECGCTMENFGMYHILSEDGTRPTYCKSCLFKLFLELNNIFELNPLLDGTDEGIHEMSLERGIGIPPVVYRHLRAGNKIYAIKAYRKMSPYIPEDEPEAFYTDMNGCKVRRHKMGLKEAKDQIDKWFPLIYREDDD